MRGVIVFVVLLVAVAAIHGGSFKPLPTAAMPQVNVP